MNINGVEVSEEDYVELAKWAHHLEKENGQLRAQNEELKSNLLAIVHQRNSLHRKVEDMKQQVTLENLNIIETEIIASSDLINPEQYRVAEYIPKSKNDIN